MSYKPDAYYICKECGVSRPMKEDTLWCRSCGGPIIGPLTKEVADRASIDPKIKERLEEINEKEE